MMQATDKPQLARRACTLTRSSVLYNMLAVVRQDHATEDLVLTDAEYETHDPVRAFVDFITHSRLEPFRARDDRWIQTKQLAHLLLLLKKYDCETALVVLRSHLKPLIRHGWLHTTEIFQAAARIDDMDMLHDVIRYNGDKKWGSSVEAGDRRLADLRLDYAIPGTSVLDIGGSPVGAFEQVPREYKEALLRAYAVRRYRGKAWEGGWGGVAYAFWYIVTGDGEPLYTYCKKSCRNYTVSDGQSIQTPPTGEEWRPERGFDCYSMCPEYRLRLDGSRQVGHPALVHRSLYIPESCMHGALSCPVIRLPERGDAAVKVAPVVGGGGETRCLTLGPIGYPAELMTY